MNGTIYLLHFSEPYKHARHYVGFTTNLEQRLDEHSKGHGARLLQVIIEAGLTFSLTRTWQGTRKDERRIKNRKEAPRLCPICKATLH
jgi:predicted GIY-YIG superfamily endonuclease